MAVATAGWRSAANDAATANLRASLAAEKAAGAALVVKERRRQVTAKGADRAVAALAGAQASHPTWAAGEVPQEVQDAFDEP